MLMPMRRTWLLRVPEIQAKLAGMEVPVIDRAVFERLFGVRRRRAIQLMHFFGGYQAGRTFLLDRRQLMGQLGLIETGAEFTMEAKRKQRLTEALEKVRRHRAGARVVLPVEAGRLDRRLGDLPDGIQLEPGSLRVKFRKAEELLAKLFALSKAAANDFEAFRRTAERR
jgi:hypothetical protein